MAQFQIEQQSAIKKLNIAKMLTQTIYIYGALGFGKTELVKSFLENSQYVYQSCAEGFFKLDDKAVLAAKTLVIDDLHMLDNEDSRKKINDLCEEKNLWLVLISRGPVPPWLLHSQVKQSFIIVDEENLALSAEQIISFYKAKKLSYNPSEIQKIVELTEGNAFALKLITEKLCAGESFDTAILEQLNEAFYIHLENDVIGNFDSELLEFLLEISVVDSVDIKLAEMITGNSRVIELFDKAFYKGNFMSVSDGVYTIRKKLLEALRRHALKAFGTVKINQFIYNAGLYYEIHGRDIEALLMFNRMGSYDRIYEILLRNARKNPSSKYYYEMREYYFGLPEEKIEESPVMLSTMSFLCGMMLQIDKSEEWYNKLKSYYRQAKGEQKREAAGLIAYLDVGLVHRGSKSLIAILKKNAVAMMNKGISIPELSIMGNLPSIMNGGKDFCRWSKKDRLLSVAAAQILEISLGKYGKGVINAGLAESLYEKGADTYEVLSLVSKAQIVADSNNLFDLKFACLSLQSRINVIHGNIKSSANLLEAFKNELIKNDQTQIIPNLNAFKCRLALLENNKACVAEWEKEAPDENCGFYIMERYRYLTKIRIYILNGEYLKAVSLVEMLRYYSEICDRIYVSMELGILSSIIKFRNGSEWEDEFLQTLAKICGFSFVRIISEEGQAVLPLIEKIKPKIRDIKGIKPDWFERVKAETARMARLYPLYLKRQVAELSDFSKNAITILRLQADGLSISEIAKKLGMKPETVKYHAAQNYKKLGASCKGDALLIARSLKLL